jgi:hypothetical protein
MPSTLYPDLMRGMTETALHTLERHEEDSKETSVEDIRRLLRFTRRWAESQFEFWEDAFAILDKGVPVQIVRSRFKRASEAINLCVRLAQGVADIVAQKEAEHPFMVLAAKDFSDMAATFRSLAAQAEAIERHAELPLPPFDPGMIERSRAEIARGEGEDVRDLLRHLEAGGEL